MIDIQLYMQIIYLHCSFWYNIITKLIGVANEIAKSTRCIRLSFIFLSRKQQLCKLWYTSSQLFIKEVIMVCCITNLWNKKSGIWANHIIGEKLGNTQSRLTAKQENFRVRLSSSEHRSTKRVIILCFAYKKRRIKVLIMITSSIIILQYAVI